MFRHVRAVEAIAAHCWVGSDGTVAPRLAIGRLSMIPLSAWASQFSQPPAKPALRNPVTIGWHRRMMFQSKPVR